MPELVRMKALRPWLNAEHEGNICDGQEFDALEDRARDLERNGFAVRITSAAQEKVQEPSAESQSSESPMEFARKDIGTHKEHPRPRSKNPRG